MAEAIICDACGATCLPKNAMHIRMHKLSSATEYKSTTLKYFDVCNKCYEQISKFLGGDIDAITEHNETTD